MPASPAITRPCLTDLAERGRAAAAFFGRQPIAAIRPGNVRYRKPLPASPRSSPAQPRDRRRDRRSSGRGGRACDPSSPLGEGARAVEERIHAAGGNATIAPLISPRANRSAGSPRRRRRWDTLDILVLDAAYARRAGPGAGIDPKEYSRLLSLNLLANQAMIAAFDPLLRLAGKADVVALTSSVGAEPRAFWGAYGSSKAALEALLGAYADETEHSGRLRVHIVDPGATRTRMRALAFPGEEPDSVKPPEVVAAAITERLTADTPSVETMRVGRISGGAHC